MTSAPVSVEVHTQRAALDALRADWDVLASRDRRDGLFRSYAWCRAWLEHIAPEAEPFVITVRDAGALIGLAPLCRSVFVDGPVRFRSLGFMGRETVSGDFLDILCAPGREDVVLDAVLGRLEADVPRGGVLVLGECVEGSFTRRRYERWIADRGLRFRRQEERTCRYIPLPATYDEYLAMVSRKLRKNLRRGTRALEKECEFVRLRGDEAVANLKHLFTLHASRWRSVGESGTFEREGFRNFLLGYFADATPADPMLYLLRHGEEPVASLLIFRWHDAVLFYQGGWDPGFEGVRHSPGQVLIARAIADSIMDGAKTFEFLQDDEEYKRRLTPEFRKTSTLIVTAKGIVPRAYVGLLRLRDRFKGRTLAASG